MRFAVKVDALPGLLQPRPFSAGPNPGCTGANNS